MQGEEESFGHPSSPVAIGDPKGRLPLMWCGGRIEQGASKDLLDAEDPVTCGRDREAQ